MATAVAAQHHRGREPHEEAHGRLREAVQGLAAAGKLRHHELLRLQQDLEKARQTHRVSLSAFSGGAGKPGKDIYIYMCRAVFGTVSGTPVYGASFWDKFRVLRQG